LKHIFLQSDEFVWLLLLSVLSGFIIKAVKTDISNQIILPFKGAGVYYYLKMDLIAIMHIVRLQQSV